MFGGFVMKSVFLSFPSLFEQGTYAGQFVMEVRKLENKCIHLTVSFEVNV